MGLSWSFCCALPSLDSKVALEQCCQGGALLVKTSGLCSNQRSNHTLHIASCSITPSASPCSSLRKAMRGPSKCRMDETKLWVTVTMRG